MLKNKYDFPCIYQTLYNPLHNQIIIKMKKQKPYHIYPAHIPLELWAKIVKELKGKPQLSDRRNSHNRIIVDALNKRYQKLKL